MAKPPATSTMMRKSRCLSSKPSTTWSGDWRTTGKPLAGAGFNPTSSPSRLRMPIRPRTQRGPCAKAIRVASIASTRWIAGTL